MFSCFQMKCRVGSWPFWSLSVIQTLLDNFDYKNPSWKIGLVKYTGIRGRGYLLLCFHALCLYSFPVVTGLTSLELIGRGGGKNSRRDLSWMTLAWQRLTFTMADLMTLGFFEDLFPLRIVPLDLINEFLWCGWMYLLSWSPRILLLFPENSSSSSSSFLLLFCFLFVFPLPEVLFYRI